MTRVEIQELLEKPYNQNDWKDFLQSHFTNNKLYGEVQTIQLAINPISKHCVTLGNYEVDEFTKIGIFEILINDKVNISRNRVALRNILKDITAQVAGAMVVFVQGDKWRFSYISKRKVKNKNTNLIEDKETAPKRFTYLFGKNEKARTASDRFEKLINKQRENIFQLLTLNDFEEAFSVEALSKDFFKKYKDTYEDFVQYLTGKRYKKQANKYLEHPVSEPSKQLQSLFGNNEKEARDFCKRMMGRIVFLYFIQKKGWLAVAQSKNWGEGNMNYLYDLFKNSNNEENFYSKELVPLFFTTLNDIESEDESRTFRFPYLNGGLFDDALDKKYNDLKLPNSIFETLFKNFSEFNFTIHEDAPDEQTVAVDPEMLGHIFENLLEDNKDKGAFYTPKEIVHYMCQESLKEYLLSVDGLQNNKDTFSTKAIEKIILQVELDQEEKQFAEKNAYKIIDALENVKICDPAIGSGAFPMGLLQEIFNAQIYLQELKGFKKINEAGIKKHIIQESIYGVDIDAGAVDIARLRFWLSLVVDEEKPQPLPNLDFKIMQGNSLLGIPYNSVIDVNADLKFESYKEKYFKENNPEKKKELKEKINYYIQKILNTANEFSSYKIDFDFKLFFSEVYHGDNSGFDIVIGNPPYVQLQKDGGKLAKLYEKSKYETFERTGDLYSLFYEKGVSLLNEKGVLCYITSNKWMRASYGDSTRQFFAEKTNPLLLIDFGSIQVFDTATVDTNILIIQNKIQNKKHNEKGLFAVRLNNDFSLEGHNLKEYVHSNGYFMTSINHNAWVVGEKDIYNIKEFIENQGMPLKNWNLKINYGIKTGFNEAYIISNAKKEELIKEDKKNAEIIKPILRGKDISFWYPDYQDLWLINSHNGLKLSGIEPVDVKNNYPSIYNWFLKYEQELSKRQDKGNDWTNLRNCAYLKEFKEPKIMYRDITQWFDFAYVEDEMYANNTIYIMTGDHLKYLTCIFNSRLFSYCFSDNFTDLGSNGRRLFSTFFEKIPIKKVNKTEELPFIKIVDYLVELKKIKSTDDFDKFIIIYFEQIANALVFEWYFKDEFEKAGISIAKHLEQLPDLNFNEIVIHQLRKIYITVNQENNPIYQAVFSMLSIPQIELIMNNN